MKEYWPTARTVLVLLFVLSVLGVGTGYATSDLSASRSLQTDRGVSGSLSDLDGMTAVTTQGSPTSRGALYIYSADGDVVYSRSTAKSYWDVDRIGEATLLYSATSVIDSAQCAEKKAKCVRNELVVLNVSTGDRRVVHDRVVKMSGGPQWHDIDKVGDNTVLIGQMQFDRVVQVNTTTGATTWSWEMQQEFSPTQSGGTFPYDWAHLNDVEKLPDGRIMLSPRNHDQVLFIRPGDGLQESWTLGEDDNYSVLNEQHNPDYLPAERGGPAVVVADSHNDRIVEYQRVEGDWVQSWVWQDERLSWPRDADRLPNGHTLITDTNGNRVVEVNRTGAVVNTLRVTRPYEAERFGTGDESAGGPSARRARLTSKLSEESGAGSYILGLFPSKLVAGLRLVTPGWMDLWEFTLAALGLGAGGVVVSVETGRRITIRSPVVRQR